MNRLHFIWILVCLLLSTSLKANRGAVYLNQFTNISDNNINIDHFLDEVRAQVGQFNNANFFSTIPNNGQDSALSVLFWIKPSNIHLHPGTVFGEDSLFNFRYLSNRELQFNHFLKKDINTKAVLCNNQWQHIAFTLNAQGLLNVFYDGECILTDTIESKWHKTPRKNYTLGSDRYNLNAEGYIDDLSIYHQALSKQKVKLLYQQSKITPPLSHDIKAYLPLNKNVKSKVKVNSANVIGSHIHFTTDKNKGQVASFGNDSAFIELVGFNYDHQLTIAAWVNPHDNKWMMPLAGNKDFSFRFTTINKELWFSVPMLFTVKSDRLWKENKNDWVHLAISVKYNHQVEFYVNGELSGSQEILGKTGESKSLSIGSSMWGQSFNGSMSEFAIWSRALDSNEIKNVYNGQLATLKFNKGIPLWLIVTIVGIILILIISILFFGKNKKETKHQPKLILKQNSIQLTGIFRAFNHEGEDITQLFSPTLIRLLALIVLFPILKNRNITSSEISDFLWENDSASQQKNNRSTNVHRLRKIFENFKGVELVYLNKEWFIKTESTFQIDVVTINQLFKNNKHKPLPTSISLCKQVRVDTFDQLIHLYEEKHITYLNQLCVHLYKEKKYTLVIDVSKLWIELAPLNEMAIKYLVGASLKNNQKQEAVNYLAHFASTYKKMLNEEFSLTIEDCAKL
ncbi:LamG domain-containing protein [Labilibacter marinus]|uniref:LamG domain-containing protein n=1 Tax=Labilibacter marinus TaxID=1477105 RepID=UPI001301832D|nr:LamG domain-containing protein [Labilibacter marinus]